MGSKRLSAVTQPRCCIGHPPPAIQDCDESLHPTDQPSFSQHLISPNLLIPCISPKAGPNHRNRLNRPFNAIIQRSGCRGPHNYRLAPTPVLPSDQGRDPRRPRKPGKGNSCASPYRFVFKFKEPDLQPGCQVWGTGNMHRAGWLCRNERGRSF